jgi:hypothetical protein
MSGAGTKILASDYNTIQALTQSVLGVGSGQYGYGQVVASSQVRKGDPFRLQDWINLRTDLLKIGAHQTGDSSEGSNLIVPGNLDPRNVTSFISKTGSGPYLITFGFSVTPGNIIPSVGAPYKIQGCLNANFNGVYKSTASTASTITLSYNNDPGSFPGTQGAGDSFSDTIPSVKISSVLTDDIRSQYLAYAQDKYAKAYNQTISITGTTNSSQTMSSANATILMLGGLVTGPGIVANTTVSAVSPGVSLTLSNAAFSTVSGGTFTITVVSGVKTVASNQLSPNEPITSITRTTVWNGNIQTVATCTFPTTDSARAFFNSGSQFEITPTLTGSFGTIGAQLTKDQTWQIMFQQVGTICFRANDCIQTPIDYNENQSQHYPIGYFGLNTSDRLVFRKQSPNGSYTPNVLNVYGRVDTTGTVLILTIRFQDDALYSGHDPAYAIDENVSGILTVNFTATRASGTNVSVVTPPVNLTSIA